jgi:hypothetical protein
MGSGENLALWEAWLDLDPQGEERADLRAGLVAAAVHGGRKVPHDFMPIIRKLEDLQRGEESAAAKRAKRKADEAALRRFIDDWNR